MVASLSFITLTLSALSLMSARPLPRQTQPEGPLEHYDTYRARYIQLQCSEQHHTAFFDRCCHPMLATENLKDRDPSCDPANASTSSLLSSTSTTTTAEATQTAVSNLGDDDNDDLDDCDDEDNSDDGDDEVCDDDDESQAPPTSSTAEVTSSATEQQALTTQEQATSTTEQQATSTAEQQPTSTTEQQATLTTEQQAPPTSTDTPPPTTTSTSQESQPTQSQGDQGNNGNNGDNGGGETVTGGLATWFLQNGQAGACGTVHSDDDLIAAIDSRRYGDTSQKSSLCGSQVLIKNANNGRSVTVTIADACPTCDNSNSIDLSKAAFEQLGDLGEGLIPIQWSLL